MRPCPFGFVKMKGLGVELLREHLDVVCGKQMRAKIEPVAHPQIVVEAHHDEASAGRRPNIAGVTMVMTHSLCAFSIS